MKSKSGARAPKLQASLLTRRMVWNLVAVILATRSVLTPQSHGFSITSTPERLGG